LTAFWVKDTRVFVHKENVTDNTAQLDNVFLETTFTNKTLSSVTQAGLVNNLNDGMIWGLLPIVLFSLHFDNKNIGIITAIYPTIWGIGQLFTGKMSDKFSKKSMLFWGMLIQGLAIFGLLFTSNFSVLALISALLGLGTALVYPTFLSTIAQATSPKQRAESIGTFRLWRDLGYAFGAVISGITADIFGLEYAIMLIGTLTVFSSLIIKFRMPGQIKSIKQCIEVEEVKQALYLSKNIQIIDVRSSDEFNQGHIPNALNISLQDLKHNDSKFDGKVRYIIACGKGGGRSAEGAKLLKEYGLNAMWLCGGTNKWFGLN
jgi:MFS family permease